MAQSTEPPRLARTFDIVSSTPVGSTRSSGSSTAMASSSGPRLASTQPTAWPRPSGSACTTDSTLISAGRATDLLQHRLLAALLQRALEHEVLDEVGDDAVLALGGDDDQPLGACLGRFRRHQFDAGRVHDGQQLLGHRLRRGQEAGPQSGGRNDSRARNGDQSACHRPHIIGIELYRRPSRRHVIVDRVGSPSKAEMRAEILAARRAVTQEVHDAEAEALCGHLPDAVRQRTDRLRLCADHVRTRLNRSVGHAVRARQAGVASRRARATPTAYRSRCSGGSTDQAASSRHGWACRSRESRGCPPSAIADASVVFVPALAVDRAGARLGRGAGFYDRTLPLAGPTARLVAVIRDDELVDELPAEPHDVPMTHALTPRGGLVELG